MQHRLNACRFELNKVGRKPICEHMLGIFREIDPTFAEAVARGIGMAIPATITSPPPGTARSTLQGDNSGPASAPSLSLEQQPKTSI